MSTKLKMQFEIDIRRCTASYCRRALSLSMARKIIADTLGLKSKGLDVVPCVVDTKTFFVFPRGPGASRLMGLPVGDDEGPALAVITKVKHSASRVPKLFSNIPSYPKDLF